MALRSYGYHVQANQVVGEPDPKVIGVVSWSQFNILYGAVMTPSQKRLMQLLDFLDTAVIENEQLSSAGCVDLLDKNIAWDSAFKRARAEFIQLATLVFFEPSVRKVRFGELVLFCKESGIELDSSNNTKELSYFQISTPAYKLRVECSWL